MRFDKIDSDNSKFDKHIAISRRIYEDVVEYRPDLTVYLGTHSHKRVYNKTEQKSGLEFWSIRLHSSDKPTRKTDIKHPDGVITDKKIVRYILEIKWGYALSVQQESDLSEMVKSGELDEIRNAISEGKTCRIGKRKFPTECKRSKDFVVTEITKFLLVSDFQKTMEHNPETYDIVIRNFDALEPRLIRLDYNQTFNSDFGVIKSFRDYITSDTSTNQAC